MKTIKNPFTSAAMKFLAASALAFMLSPLCSYADDTAALQAQLTAGPVTLTAGHVYSVTGNLTVTYNFNLNGATLNMTGTSGPVLRVRNPNITVSNGSIIGTWSPSTAYNPSGTTGISLYASNITVTKMTITNMSNYGIVAGGTYNGLVITYNTIKNVGYIGFYYDSESTTNGGTFSNNVVDNSALPAATVSALAVGIRGSQTSGTLTNGWTIANNTIKMPVQPTNITAECMEVKYMTNSTLSNNVLVGGSIGESLVRTTGLTISGCNFSGQSLEAIEFADSHNGIAQNNVITSSYGVGELLDGAVGSMNIAITNDVISGTTRECIQAYTGCQTVSITNCNLTATGAKAVNVQGASAITITNTNFKGNGVGQLAVMLDCSPGNLVINGGTISNFTKAAIGISCTKAGLTTTGVNDMGVTLSGTPKGIVKYVANGGAIASTLQVQ